MKKVRNRSRRLRYDRRRRARVLRQREHRRAFTYARNVIRSDVRTTPKARAGRPRGSPQWKVVKAPEFLSFVGNPDAVAQFIGQLRNRFDNKLPAYIDFEGVTRVDYDALIVLLSVLVRFRAKRIGLSGNTPLSPQVKRTFEESRFFEYLFGAKFKDTARYSLAAGSSIHTDAQLKVDSVLGERIIAAASETVWGEKRRCPGVQRAFIELMQNTNEHAAAGADEAKHWWLSVKHSKDHKVAFAFVDFGVGIFRSLRGKKRDDRLHGVLDVMKRKLSKTDDADVLRLIFEGELHKTKTGKYYRGKGLPGVYQALQKHELSALVMITNDVYFNSRTEEYRKLDHEFMGTFVYWELDSSNSSLPNAN